MFPRHIWAKYLKAPLNLPNMKTMITVTSGDSTRALPSATMYSAKGIQCSPEQIVIVSGATEGFLLLAKSLSSKFHSIYIEDPTIDITRDIFQTMNYNLVPVEVDHSGMRVDALSSIAPGHLVLLTPSHQFPTGAYYPFSGDIRS